MTYIYRLRPSNEKTIEELAEKYLWFSKPSEFNDINDANIVAFSQKNRTIKEFLNKVFRNFPELLTFTENIGICCFTSKIPSANSWKKFPNCKNGILIEYDKNKITDYFATTIGLGDCFKKIEYLENPTIFEQENENNILWKSDDNLKIYKSLVAIEKDPKLMDQLFLKMFTRLSDKFKKQKEERIIITDNHFQIDKINSIIQPFSKGYKVPLKNGEILRVYYSRRTPKEFIDKLKSLNIELIEIRKNAG